jgi:hypothetical protein
MGDKIMQKNVTFINHGLLGESGYTSPTLELTLHDEDYTREDMLEHFQQFLVGIGYPFSEHETIKIHNGE